MLLKEHVVASSRGGSKWGETGTRTHNIKKRWPAEGWHEGSLWPAKREGSIFSGTGLKEGVEASGILGKSEYHLSTAKHRASSL